jgi:hypothetical protein
MSELVVCEVCHRHVKAKDERCPFCSHGMSARNSALGIAGAIVVTVGLSLAACGDEASGGGGTGGNVTALYAGPPTADASTEGGGGGIAAYAPPVFVDGGASKSDAGSSNFDGGASALYASPALHDGGT